jgi:ATP adenylyltransferase
MDKLWAPWRLEYIQGPEDGECIFCVDDTSIEDRDRLIIVRRERSYLMMNRYPYSNGHLMVSPYRHLGSADDLEECEVLEIHQLMIDSQKVLREVCAAQGFNVGWNFGRSAGAGIVDHIHMHVVPRWAGDSNFMTILADTRVIPQHIEQTYTLLAKAFAEL